MYVIKEDSTGFLQSSNELLDHLMVLFTETKAIEKSRFISGDDPNCCGDEIIHFAISNGTILTIDSRDVIKPKLAA